MQSVEHINHTLSDIERVKAHGGQRRPDKFSDGEIIRANESHLLWHPYTEASQRTEQDHRVLIAKGIDPRGTIRTHEGGLNQRKSSRGREVQWQDVQAYPGFLSESSMHSLQPLQERFFLYRIIWMHEGKMAMTALKKVLGSKISQRLAGKDNGIGLLNRFCVEPDKDDMLDPHLTCQSDIFSREVEGTADDADRATRKDRLMQVLSLLN